MKKFFAIYLPVKGEIKEGDWFQDEHGNFYICVKHINGRMYGSGYAEAVNKKKAKLAKLFLCSRDIQVGDEIFCPAMQRANEKVPDAGINPYFTINTEEERQSAFGTKSIKVIGEISPEAIWVKEGDEFDEEQVQWRVYKSGNIILGKLDDSWFTNRSKTIAIKGPCGHFH